MSKENDIQESVLDKIRAGGVSMRPRYYFTTQVVLIGIVSILALVFSVFVLSFGVFSIHESGEQFLLGFGTQGLAMFVSLFPWGLLVSVLVLLVLLETLLRNFRFAYRTPALRIFVWLLLLASVGSAAIGFTSLHPFLSEQADHDALPVIGSFYEQIHDSQQPRGVYRGRVVSVSGSRFVLVHDDYDDDADDGSWTVELPVAFDAEMLSVGARVYVAGQLQNGVIYAYGVRVISDEDD